jgi:hypothetical protein
MPRDNFTSSTFARYEESSWVAWAQAGGIVCGDVERIRGVVTVYVNMLFQPFPRSAENYDESGQDSLFPGRRHCT